MNRYVNLDNEKEFIKYLTERGFEQKGVETRTHLRKELIGKPKFKGLAGPMYDGEDCVRYEDWETFEILSR
tara:strand:- start:119 stop:331 length:213 start_codon:yes stop_codon:yes gene_type:complete